MGLGVAAFVLFFGIILIAASVRIVQEYERGVIFRLGRVVEGAKGPGLFFIIPIIDRMVKVNLQIVTLDVPSQDVITKDNVTLRVNAVVYFQVFQPVRAVVEIQNYLYATSQIAQTTLRAVLSKRDMDEILAERDKLNVELQGIIDDLTDPWGVKVTHVEIKDVDLAAEMIRAMSKQAEAERERRAKIINAEGEYQASAKLAEAAHVMSQHPLAYQLRYLQTITDVSAEKNSTLVIPIPVELLRGFKDAFDLVPEDSGGPTASGAPSTPGIPGGTGAPDLGSAPRTNEESEEDGAPLTPEGGDSRA